jgi:hypothetical protein
LHLQRGTRNAHLEVRRIATYVPLHRKAVMVRRASFATCCWWPVAAMLTLLEHYTLMYFLKDHGIVFCFTFRLV